MSRGLPVCWPIVPDLSHHAISCYHTPNLWLFNIILPFSPQHLPHRLLLPGQCHDLHPMSRGLPVCWPIVPDLSHHAISCYHTPNLWLFNIILPFSPQHLPHRLLLPGQCHDLHPMSRGLPVCWPIVPDLSHHAISCYITLVTSHYLHNPFFQHPVPAILVTTPWVMPRPASYVPVAISVLTSQLTLCCVWLEPTRSTAAHRVRIATQGSTVQWMDWPNKSSKLGDGFVPIQLNIMHMFYFQSICH